jgi:hypothetical protein
MGRQGERIGGFSNSLSARNPVVQNPNLVGPHQNLTDPHPNPFPVNPNPSAPHPNPFSLSLNPSGPHPNRWRDNRQNRRTMTLPYRSFEKTPGIAMAGYHSRTYGR